MTFILEVMMHEALKSIDFGVQVCGEPVNNLIFADDIDLIAESDRQLQELTDKVNECSKLFGIMQRKQRSEKQTCMDKTGK